MSKAELDDIEEGTAIFYWKDKDDFYIVLTDEIVEGNLDAVRVSDSRVTVDGTNVSKAGDAIFSDNEMKDFKEWESYADIKDCVDEDVVVYKNLVGKAIALVTDAKAKSSKIYGIATWKTDARKPVLSVYTIEGKEIDYKFAETKDAAKASAQKADDGYEVVAFKLNKDGEIAKDEFEVISKAITFNKVDKDKFATDGTDGGNKYYLTKDTVILKALNSKGEIKPSVIGYDDIIKKTIDENNEAIIGTVKDKGNDLAVVVFIDSDFDAVDETEYGLVTGAPIRVGKNYEVEIDMVGKGVGDYILVEADANVDKGDLIKFTFNHKDEVDVEDSISSVKETGSKVTKKAGNYLTIDGEEYRVTSDTVYYATNKNGKLDGTTRLSKIDKGDRVVILANGKNELQVVVVVSAYKGGSVVDPVLPKDAVEYKGVVTLDGNNYISLGKDAYPFTGKVPADVKKGDLVIPTFITIRDETVVAEIVKYKEEQEEPDDPDLEDKIIAGELKRDLFGQVLEFTVSDGTKVTKVTLNGGVLDKDNWEYNIEGNEVTVGEVQNNDIVIFLLS